MGVTMIFRSNMVSKKSKPVKETTSAICPLWLEFLNSIFKGEKQRIRFVQRAASKLVRPGGTSSNNGQ